MEQKSRGGRKIRRENGGGRRRESGDSSRRESSDDRRRENGDSSRKGNSDDRRRENGDSSRRENSDDRRRENRDSIRRENSDDRRRESGDSSRKGNSDDRRRESGDSSRKGNSDDRRRESGDNSRRGNGDIRRENDGGSRGVSGGDRREKSGGKSPCPVSKKCGGCTWIYKPYGLQLATKEKRFQELMEPFVRPEKIIGMERPEHYRHKVHAVFGMGKGREIVSGTYESGTHRIVPVENCLIEHEQADAVIRTVRELMKSFKIRPYNEDTGFGLLRHVLVRVSHATGELMVVLVLADPILPSKNNFVRELRKRHPQIATVVLNINDKQTSMVLGEREIVLYGKGYIEDVLCGRKFRISARSFYQVNPVQTERLYDKALEYAGLTGKERVVDAYCGIGTIGLIASDRAGEVIGIELNPDAVRDARFNARLNQVRNISFYQNDATIFLGQMAEQGASADVVFLDPPRSGSTEEFMDSVAVLSPARIVYISCNPETLARDLAYLVKKGYRAKRAVGVDMFPFTEHLECVVLMEKRDT